VWKPNIEKMGKAMKSLGVKTGMAYYVSQPFIHLDDHQISYTIMAETPMDLWYVKGEHISVLFTMWAQDMKCTMPYFMTSFQELPIRKTPYGDNEYKRRQSGKSNSTGRTINRIFFTLRISLSEATMFNQVLKGALKKIHRLFHPEANPGLACFRYLKANHEGIINFFRKDYPKDNDMIQFFQDTLVDGFSRKRNVVTNCALDRFLMDNDIKNFLQSTGANGWNDLNDKLGNIFHDYPRKALPDWDGIKLKPYDQA